METTFGGPVEPPLAEGVFRTFYESNQSDNGEDGEFSIQFRFELINLNSIKCIASASTFSEPAAGFI